MESLQVDNVWEERWQQGRTGWDQSSSHPLLVSFLQSEKAGKLGVPTKGRALVPGCGMGYDVHLFAQRGLETIGVDLAPTCVQAAKKWLASQPSTKGKSEIIVADFFEYDPEEKFDLIFDYTFLCALPPDSRTAWSRQLVRLSKPDSPTTLITLMYPLPPQSQSVGPPWPLTEEIYHELLAEDWNLVWAEDVPPDMMRTTGAKGGEKLGVWTRRSGA
ncbi:hypothetical protein IAR55_006678 [Kwoniella newhampshirensis]|uniref:Thiol methyltransferase 1 n=1 Tax=Kwoniella newhampshirensis TaxID=1651941 RepID=A0AAW0YJA5_9TREE